MRDTLDPAAPPAALPEISRNAKAEALHALGSFYVRQGYPRQGLSLLLTAADYGQVSRDLARALAHAYLLCGMPKQTLRMLDELRDPGPASSRGETALRARALLALGRADEARTVMARMTGGAAAEPLPAQRRRRIR